MRPGPPPPSPPPLPLVYMEDVREAYKYAVKAAITDQRFRHDDSAAHLSAANVQPVSAPPLPPRLSPPPRSAPRPKPCSAPNLHLLLTMRP